MHSQYCGDNDRLNFESALRRTQAVIFREYLALTATNESVLTGISDIRPSEYRVLEIHCPLSKQDRQGCGPREGVHERE